MFINCSVLKTTKFIGKKWTLLIFLELFKGKNKWKRFNELKRRLPGITPKMLSKRLNDMINSGLVLNKIDNSVVPNMSNYALTSCGKDLIKITKEYKNWALKWKTKNKLCKEQDCNKCKF